MDLTGHGRTCSAVYVKHSVAEVEDVVGTILDRALQAPPCAVRDVGVVRCALAQALHGQIKVLELSLHEAV